MLDGLIDSAGLFPPAKLGMSPAVESYARDRAGLHTWMLGRFVCHVSRLDEFSKAAAPLMPGTFATSGYREHADIAEPWRISAIIDSLAGPKPHAALERDLVTIDRFNERHSLEDRGLARVDYIELKAPSVDFIDGAIELIPDDIFPFFEIVPSPDPRGEIAALAGNAAGAKLRTGGITPDAFPTARAIAGFLVACRHAEIPFKATAGLHHPVRGTHPLTYEPASPSCMMHGFLNVFAAAALAHALRLDTDTVSGAIEETNPGAFVFTDDGLSWRRHVLDVTQIARAREAFALSFGSCSFDDPVADLKAIQLL
jgi:hypothetical protein